LRKGQAVGTADSESFALLRDRGLTQTGGSRALGDVTVGYSELRSVARAQDRPVMDLVDLTASVRTHPHKSLKGSLGGWGDDEGGAIDDDASTDRDISCFDGSWTGVNVVGVLEGVASGDCAGSGQGSDTSNGAQDLASGGGHFSPSCSAGTGVAGGCGDGAVNHTGFDKVIHAIDPMNFVPVRVQLDHRGGGVLKPDPVRFAADGVVSQISGKLWGDEMQQHHGSDRAVGDDRDALVIIVGIADPLGYSAGAVSSLGGGLDASFAPPVLGDGLGENSTVCDGRQR